MCAIVLFLYVLYMIVALYGSRYSHTHTHTLHLSQAAFMYIHVVASICMYVYTYFVDLYSVLQICINYTIMFAVLLFAGNCFLYRSFHDCFSHHIALNQAFCTILFALIFNFMPSSDIIIIT